MIVVRYVFFIVVMPLPGPSYSGKSNMNACIFFILDVRPVTISFAIAGVVSNLKRTGCSGHLWQTWMLHLGSAEKSSSN